VDVIFTEYSIYMVEGGGKSIYRYWDIILWPDHEIFLFDDILELLHWITLLLDPSPSIDEPNLNLVVNLLHKCVPIYWWVLILLRAIQFHLGLGKGMSNFRLAIFWVIYLLFLRICDLVVGIFLQLIIQLNRVTCTSISWPFLMKLNLVNQNLFHMIK